MKKEIADKWTKALRSGEYKQGKFSLKAEGEYCCLGVLCDISKQGIWVKAYAGDRYHLTAEINSGDMPSVSGFLPSKLEKWADISSQCKLSRMNDKEKLSFLEIADYIDENYQNL